MIADTGADHSRAAKGERGMRILVVGAGAIGGISAGACSKPGAT